MANKTQNELPEIHDIEDILAVDDIKILTQLTKQLNVDTGGCKTKDDIKDRLIGHFNFPQPEDQFVKAQENQRDVAKHLFKKFQMAERLYKDLPEKLQGNLQQSYPRIIQQFQERSESMRRGECWILVAGEVGAGKSSIINLFLGSQLLPTDALKCTNTIVEIRSSDRKEALCFFREPQPGAVPKPKVIKMNDLKGIQEFKDCAVETLDELSDDNPYERIELYYPFKSLNESIVVVDTPGIEGGNNVDQRLQTYLSKAFGFIYVINTNTAGGVQQSRLGHLLKTVVNSCDEFSPEASFFVGNKWENVPVRDKEDVQKDIFAKLTKVYPGVRGHQIHYMSTAKCTEVAMKHKTHAREHAVLLQKIGQLVPNCLRQGMTNHYWWLSSFLTRASYLLRVTGVRDLHSHDELERQYKDMQLKVEQLEKNSEIMLKRLQERVEFEIFKIIKLIKEELTSRTFQNNVCNWEDQNECPQVEKKWKRTADEAAVRISERIARVVDGWQRNSGVLRNIDKEIINVFSNEFGLLESQVNDIQGFLTESRGKMRRENTVKIVPVKKLFAKKTKKIERTYNTLGGAVSCIGMLNTDRKEVKKIFREYSEKNKARQMGEATVVYLTSILDHKDLPAKLRKFFDRFFRDIDEAAKRLPQFIQADQQLIETLRKSIDGITLLKQKLPELAGNCADQHGSLNIFYVNSIMKFDYDIDELEWDQRRHLGKGSFADVFKSEIKRKRRPVALKVSIEAVNQDNVTDILREDRCMRDLRHPNVIKYYGASYIKKKGFRWIMVMELCKETLKDYYTGGENRDKKVPGSIPSGHPRRKEAMCSMLGHALDIARGVNYIHEKGYTHRDLKMENILLTDNGTATITDVGVAKATNILVRTVDGSPAYMAPEVLLQTKNQTNKIDIYSMTLIIWEMWFGADMASDMNKEILGGGFAGDAMTELKKRMAAPGGGWRPSLRSANKPPDKMVEMMKLGWHEDPDRRPTAKMCVDFFDEMLKSLQ